MNDELLELFQTARRYLRCAVNVCVPGLPVERAYVVGVYIADDERVAMHVRFGLGTSAYVDFNHVELI